MSGYYNLNIKILQKFAIVYVYMPEGHNGNFDKGQRPPAGEQQARAAEKIITDAQRKTPRASFDAARLFGANTHDQDRLTEVRKSFQEEYGQKRGRGDGNVIRVITPNGVATTPEELAKLNAEWLKASDERFERLRREAVAKLSTFSRLPFWEKLSMLISGAPTDQEKYDEILEQERRKQGL